MVFTFSVYIKGKIFQSTISTVNFKRIHSIELKNKLTFAKKASNSCFIDTDPSVFEYFCKRCHTNNDFDNSFVIQHNQWVECTHLFEKKIASFMTFI